MSPDAPNDPASGTQRSRKLKRRWVWPAAAIVVVLVVAAALLVVFLRSGSITVSGDFYGYTPNFPPSGQGGPCEAYSPETLAPDGTIAKGDVVEVRDTQGKVLAASSVNSGKFYPDFGHHNNNCLYSFSIDGVTDSEKAYEITLGDVSKTVTPDQVRNRVEVPIY